MKVVFFGTPRISAEVLDYLLKNQINIVAVISKPDKAQGRSKSLVPVPVKLIAQAHQPPIPIFQPDKVSSLDFAPTLESFQADLFVVVAYGEILKQHVLDMPKKGCINMHASLLPKYRGAAPIQRVIMNGETETGVTIMHMVKQMDAGDMIKKIVIPISQEMTAGELETKISSQGSKILLEIVKSYEHTIPPSELQDHSQMTLAPKVELIDCQVDWKLPASKLHDLIRGSNPEPGAWCSVELNQQPKRLRLFQTRLSDKTGLPGQILSYGKLPWIIACGQGSLELVEVQLEGKKLMPASELMRGYKQDAWKF